MINRDNIGIWRSRCFGQTHAPLPGFALHLAGRRHSVCIPHTTLAYLPALGGRNLDSPCPDSADNSSCLPDPLYTRDQTVRPSDLPPGELGARATLDQLGSSHASVVIQLQGEIGLRPSLSLLSQRPRKGWRLCSLTFRKNLENSSRPYCKKGRFIPGNSPCL